MKKIVAVIGSPRNGESLKAVRGLERRLKSLGAAELEYVFLKDSDIRPCKGCFLCLSRGEEFCPHKDDVPRIHALIAASDGVLFATPNYSMQVTALAKNFLDRSAYIFHRPRYFGKVFMGLVTQAVYGGEPILKYLEELAAFWGFSPAPGVLLNILERDQLPSEARAVEDRLDSVARELSWRLDGPRFPRPPLKFTFIFGMVRTLHRLSAEDSSCDYRYYREKGWFESPYYYPVGLGPLGSAARKAGEIMGARLHARRAREKAGLGRVGEGLKK